jgi:hypothetical protein
MVKSRNIRNPARRATRLGRTDWKRIGALTIREIERIAVADRDNPAPRATDWADAVVGLPPLARGPSVRAAD